MKTLLRLLDLNIEYKTESTPIPKQYILIVNHLSVIDALVLIKHFPNIYIFTDIEHERIFLLGRLIKLWNFIGVDRKSQSSKIRSMQTLIDHLAKGKSILIFPQGETSKNIQNFNIGAFVAAKKTFVPIVPVFLEFKTLNEFYFCPPWNVMNAFKKIYRSADKTITIRQFNPVSPGDFSNSAELKEYCLKKYQQWYQQFQVPLINLTLNMKETS